MADDMAGDQQAGGSSAEQRRESPKSAVLGLRPIAAAVMLVALAAFVVQNGDSTAVKWLWFDGSAPLFAVIVVSALAGAVLSELAGWMLRRRRRQR